ncbi:MAG: DNA protecting protein DprA [Candidatus Schekmanbacteria bacterium RIFCSPHIGHO2_02_FULL_38_11]|uniref:DNA protecting protein DprA n=1 Tax=Candidatus Schekmanbacteria bacterium RIFCSPLOWO2_12_FULL_38_15 TaxID=1817883 RepID=A0A1F7SJN2_9BACT|nr:MAG: DNA protecting protein DprA [Candidatus Schekmanbacteria bacterium GWA2_38_9]OGL51208.1 MAG: DNA protecting protein DprA [Candidatus Schekmanbacteria bacterium RIFCSPHIGHO2_02_FULL_38_11]OGL51769.1 MAG: DNA protecting protein DprA [Candidatus Schekmanbacteria bacterium RIFCSPLOWO2_02_FULL_38_14]OGL53982.1 MAG: DNA protecting protein DprA [Candidatus Schekmanbacteria bacterium RIFCSPLOWO2_12_FULL_38_15]
MDNNKKDWIALNLVSGIGKILFTRLLQHFGTASNVLKVSYNDLIKVRGIGDKLAKEIISLKDGRLIEEELRLINENSVEVLTLDSPEYPATLKTIHNPPPVLYVKGSIKDFEPGIAIVGSRNPTYYGKAITEKLTGELVARGFAIVSGMARGIDTVAHTTAIEKGGKTFAVLGSGLNVIYPQENSRLAERISTSGAVISEFPMKMPPHRENFPVRNRIISGLSLGTLVVEASEKSGALITAKQALEQGREVFAIPGNINARNSKGTNSLIKEGAKLVEDISDIISELNVPQKSKTGAGNEASRETRLSLSKEETIIYSLINENPVHIDVIAKESNLPVNKVSAILLNLEMNGIIKQEAGKLFARISW